MAKRISNFPDYAIHISSSSVTLCKSLSAEKPLRQTYKNTTLPALERECGAFFDPLTQQDTVEVFLDATTPLLFPKSLSVKPSSHYAKLMPMPSDNQMLLEDEIDDYIAVFPYSITKIAQLQALLNCQLSLHHTDHYCVQVLQQLPCDTPFKISVQSLSQRIEVILLEDQRLQLVNSFKYTTLEDILYYILNILQQFSIPQSQNTLFLVNPQALPRAERFLKKYLPNVQPMEPSFLV